MSGSIALQCQGGQGACGVGVWHQGGWGVWPRCASTSLTTGAGAAGGGGGREGGNGDWFGSVRLSLTHSPGLLGLPRQCMPGFLPSLKYVDSHSGKDQQPRC